MPNHSKWPRVILHWAAVVANCFLAAACPYPMCIASQADVGISEADFAITLGVVVPVWALFNIFSLVSRGRGRTVQAARWASLAVNAAVLLAATAFAIAAIAGYPYYMYPFSGHAVEAAPFLVIGLLTGLALLCRRSSPAESPTCASCGYSLIGLAAGHPCPECGARPEA